MGEAAADPDRLERYSDEQTIDALYLQRLLSGTTQGLIDQYWFAHPDMLAANQANASGITDAISAVVSAGDVDRQVGVVGQAFRFAGGTGPMSDATLAQVIALNPNAHDDAYWHALEKIGTTGTDATLRDEANRELLGHDVDVLRGEQTVETNALRTAMKSGDQAAIDKAEAALKEIDRRQGIYQHIQTGLNEKGNQPHYLLQFDTTGPTGHSIVSTGDPFTAKNVATIVPGTFAGGTKTDTYVHDADLLSQQMGTTSGTTAVIAWNGYDAPQSLPEAALPTYAINGAAALSAFEQQLRSANPSARLTVIGHSYGNVTVSYAALHGLPVDNVAFIASPAVPPQALAKLELQGVHLYGARLPYDEITVADHASETIDGFLPIATPLVGTDPLNFPGVEHFHTGFARENGKIIGGSTDILNDLWNGDPGKFGNIHNDYFTTPGALQNLAAISNGLPVTKPTASEQRPGEIANDLQHLAGLQIPGLEVPLPGIPGVDWGNVHLPDVSLPDIHLPSLPDPTDYHLPVIPPPSLPSIPLPSIPLPDLPDIPDPF